ncbi:interferon-induced 35 kDa protein [Mantella aurantiaca]
MEMMSQAATSWARSGKAAFSEKTREAGGHVIYINSSNALPGKEMKVKETNKLRQGNCLSDKRSTHCGEEENMDKTEKGESPKGYTLLCEEQSMDITEWVQPEIPGSTHLGEGQNLISIEKVQVEIKMYEEKLSSLLCEIKSLETEKESSEQLAEQLQDSVDTQKVKIRDYEEELAKNEKNHKKKVGKLVEENEKLEAHNQVLKEKIQYFETESENLKKICSSEMVKNMVFKGNVSHNMSSLSVKHQIKYPVNGGSALITFQKPSVAAEIISAEKHKVKVEECWIHVKSEAVELSVLEALNVAMNLSPAKILVYKLPSDLTEEVIMDKLELFFGKSKNGGGEVEKREFLADCRSAILTFMDINVASRLVEKKCFHVPFGDSKNKVYVAPALEGNLQDYKMRKLECNRTVLITGIPDITEKDTLRDLLEIHFQKPSNGGGEVQELMYCAQGEHTVALFEDDEDNGTFTE